MRVQRDSQPGRELAGRRLMAARTAWVLVAAFCVVTFLLAIPARFEQLGLVTPEAVLNIGQMDAANVRALEALGLSLRGYAAYFTLVEVVSASLFVLVGALVSVRRSSYWNALIVSLTLIAVGTGFTPLRSALGWQNPAWTLPVNLTRALFAVSFYLFFLWFPDGRFVPRWTRWLAAAWVIYTLAWVAYPPMAPPLGIVFIGTEESRTTMEIVSTAWVGLILPTALYAQAYRYRRVSGRAERQQTKWVVFGVLGSLSVVFAVAMPLFIVPSLRSVSPAAVGYRLLAINTTLIGLTMLPVTVGISVLRHQLFDIDLIIRRTLIYGALTATLAGAYLVSVLVLQAAFRRLTGQGNQLAIVASTLGIAALFVPVRRRIQQGIDRRFYRSKYDAEKVLAAFGVTVREEVDLERLTGKLLAAVQETMQPAHMSLWLKSSNAKTPGRKGTE